MVVGHGLGYRAPKMPLPQRDHAIEALFLIDRTNRSACALQLAPVRATPARTTPLPIAIADPRVAPVRILRRHRAPRRGLRTPSLQDPTTLRPWPCAGTSCNGLRADGTCSCLSTRANSRRTGI